MTKLAWDAVGERFYETGVDHGVLYIPDENGDYSDGVAWNGLTTVTEKPSGGESNPQYADNIKYLNLLSAEQFGATIEAFTYPDEFAQFDGLVSPYPGVNVGGQGRGVFGLSYRTQVGNDVEGSDLGYKLHLVYGCQASPSEKAYGTINDSPEAIAFSWEVTTTPVLVSKVGDLVIKPTSIITIDQRTADADALTALEDLLYGGVATDPQLPSPDTVIALFAGTLTEVNAVNPPTYDAGTHVVTIPTTTGVDYYVDGELTPAGAMAAMTDTPAGQYHFIEARAKAGYHINSTLDADWRFDY